MFNFSNYADHELKQMKEAAETLLYFGFGLGEMIHSLEIEIKKRERG